MADLTNYLPKWSPGLPHDGASGYWLGESADGRRWLMRWEIGYPCWLGAGFFRDPNWAPDALTGPEFRLMQGENRDFIVRHTPLPASRQEEAEPTHPGEVLREEFLKPHEMTAQSLAAATQLPTAQIEALLREQTAITPEIAEALGPYFKTSPQFWMNLQAEYERRAFHVKSAPGLIKGTRNV